MSTRRQRQILRNKKLEFERQVEENRKESETKIVKKTTKKKAEKK